MAKSGSSKILPVILSILLIGLLAVTGYLTMDIFSLGGKSKNALTSNIVNEQTQPNSPTTANSKSLFVNQELKNDELGIQIKLDDFDYQVNGFVGSEETKKLLEEASEQVMQGQGKYNFTVVENIVEPGWVKNVPLLIKDFAETMQDGEIIITEDKTQVAGVAPQQPFKDTLIKSLQTAGVPEIQDNISIGNLELPTFHAVIKDGKVTLTGSLPSQKVIDKGVTDLQTLFGDGTVTNNMTVDKNIYAPFRITRWAKSFAILKPFGDVETGNVKGQVYANIRDNLNYDVGSSSLSPELSKNIAGITPYLQATSTNKVVITGHTDADGSEEINQQLSLDRAKSAKKIFTDRGIAPERIEVYGKGSSDPIAPNDTDENKAKNRRITMEVKPITEN